MSVVLLFVSDAVSNPLPTDFSKLLAWCLSTVSLIVGVFAIFQSYHYYKISNVTLNTTNRVLESMNTAVTQLEAVNNILTEKVWGIFEKTVDKVTKVAVSGSPGNLNVNIKKDLEKTITDGTDKIEGQIKSVTDSFDKNQVNISEIKESLQVVANAVQQIFNNVIKNIDDYDQALEEEYDYIKRKIFERCANDNKATVKDIFTITSHKIAIDSKMETIKLLKTAKIIDYKGDKLYDTTILFIERKLLA